MILLVIEEFLWYYFIIILLLENTEFMAFAMKYDFFNDSVERGEQTKFCKFNS